ncbi:5,6-dimethylbenzimidazole synthase [Tenacibaculum finnmarkense]|uniref:5,6-dimethylbenzimidazole synthase n=1 Tax=Tenacibaculum finnmarkense TaxID=2781243 RepID=UPI001E387F12|nr:5,6-dimethylbenzimidazole synthase [Tenacibaculum finnmarkense]MCD8411869.1 5,6-dimethylbenzimidazole synthase [Tenacibaculum finnmarkense genomovar ulcerans]MCG8206190.1 5,6-dimethylbenzimidazole synthase [Tenacibaculum finnmarkense genomovar finnmarkense]MCG8722306.1 5,6-dimethylbenzimidazole synthase [Tenacibaculum finnmarkense]MCG8740563.1 5,6-dimethylbenzimidazole synthase [Tenacibaculum finnmarkense]MCG8763975.1 5,6-dimethylbenzimidazole synthase [Tenacibaculum finnmarkense]
MNKFTPENIETLEQIILARRDVRGNRFINTPISKEHLDKILFAGVNAPSVGFSQPWEFVVIKDLKIRNKIKDSFFEENEKAKTLFEGKKADAYTQLKLEGIVESALNIAVFYKPSQHPVLGQTSMKEAGVYSVVCAIQNMWLMARALNVGLGWVSVLNENNVKTILNAPDDRQLIGYLCLGHVDKFYENPELERLKWEKRKNINDVVIKECYQ